MELFDARSTKDNPGYEKSEDKEVSGKHIPGETRPKLLHRKAVVECFSSIPPIFLAGVTAYQLFLRPETSGLAVLALTAMLWLIGSTIVKTVHAHHQDKSSSEAPGVDGLRGALCVLHAAAGLICEIPREARSQSLRVTFHRVVPADNDEEQFLEQLVHYVGGDESGAGRRFSVRSGITGRAVRNHSVYTSDFAGSPEERKKELIESWGYTLQDLPVHSIDRLSSMAVPILDTTRRHVLGVVYLDSDRKNVFSSEEVQSLIVEACQGITKFVSEKY